jgi:hypothetical protein
MFNLNKFVGIRGVITLDEDGHRSAFARRAVLEIRNAILSPARRSTALFLLATIPRGYYQILNAEFNVDQGPVALVASGTILGVFTIGFHLVKLILRVNRAFLAIAWILGNLLGLFVGQSNAGKRRALSANPVTVR